MRVSVKLKSTKSHHFYTTKKNKKNTPEKLKLKKYGPVDNEHVE